MPRARELRQATSRITILQAAGPRRLPSKPSRESRYHPHDARHRVPFFLVSLLSLSMDLAIAPLRSSRGCSRAVRGLVCAGPRAMGPERRLTAMRDA